MGRQHIQLFIAYAGCELIVEIYFTGILPFRKDWYIPFKAAPALHFSGMAAETLCRQAFQKI